MNTWSNLVASAVVGTSRQEPSIDLTHPALSDYAESLQTQSPNETQLVGTPKFRLGICNGCHN